MLPEIRQTVGHRLPNFVTKRPKLKTDNRETEIDIEAMKCRGNLFRLLPTNLLVASRFVASRFPRIPFRSTSRSLNLGRVCLRKKEPHSVLFAKQAVTYVVSSQQN